MDNKQLNRIAERLDIAVDALSEVWGETDDDNNKLDVIRDCLTCLRVELTSVPETQTNTSFSKLHEIFGWTDFNNETEE